MTEFVRIIYLEQFPDYVGKDNLKNKCGMSNKISLRDIGTKIGEK